jgi:ABC-type lipoprotein release transport system permease subunit
VLAAILAVMAAATLTHTLITSIRRRRHDLAMLKTLGLAPAQIRRVVAWQATTLGGVALLFGLPLGLAAGRWAWTLFADQLGVAPQPVAPALALLLAIPATIILANLIATAPAWAAGRTRPALVLRAE